jgi:anti-sigma regulatory factor (Ser/Thr protein kinase)
MAQQPHLQRAAMDLEGGVVAASSARRAVQALIGDAPVQFVNDALLLTSEVVTNAAVHTDGPSRLEARYDNDRRALVVEVTGQSTVFPVRRPSPLAPQRPADPTGGYGLHLLDTIATMQSLPRCPSDMWERTPTALVVSDRLRPIPLRPGGRAATGLGAGAVRGSDGPRVKPQRFISKGVLVRTTPRSTQSEVAD